ncbi:MAG TPA: queuosine precursor transporter [archaeon]|nr:queuosine precursor transporter [archaeon]
MLKQFDSLEFRTTFLGFIFIASVITSNLLGGKVSEINLLGIPIIFSVGLIPFFMTFFILDAVNEVHGRQKARELIWLAMLTLVFVSIVTIIAVSLPYAERSWIKADAFEPVFNQSLRIIVASILAFFFADQMDTRVFSYLKEKTKGNFLWLRSNVSNIIGQTIDTLIFMFIAFFDLAKGYDAGFVIALAIPYLVLKIALSFVNTPFVYAGVKWLQGSK